MSSKPWRFYVYEIMDSDGAVVYVGKGSGRRLAVQSRKFGCNGREVARFKRERDAYAFEIVRIAECAPSLNRHPGGNGSRAQRVYTRGPLWIREMEKIGTRRYAARFLLSRAVHLIEPSTVDALRKIADGPRA